MKTERLALLWVTLLSGGCYSYQPVRDVAPKTGTRVSVTLTEHAVAEFSPKLGPQAMYVEGNVLEADSSGLRLAVVRVEDARRIATDWRGEQVTFPRDAIARVSERKLSIGATAIISGLAVGSVVGAYLAFDPNGKADGVSFPTPQGNQ
jgi:hypothetical protein